MNPLLSLLIPEFENLLEHNILAYWLRHGMDTRHGGFVGHVDFHNRPVERAEKGSVLNARILWTFSAAYRVFPKPEYLAAAQRAFDYMLAHFTDKENGGVYWSVDYVGQPGNTRKQTYAQAFAVYAYSEFYAATGNVLALEKAQQLFGLMEQHCREPWQGGYVEALGERWEEIADVRLSAKDANEKKSMNTHLHVLEAYANLARVWPAAEVRASLRALLEIFVNHIIDAHTGHFNLFFDEAWRVRSNIASYGHDIEGAWLLAEAAHVCGDAALQRAVAPHALRLVEVALEGLDTDGGLMNEKNLATGHLDTDKHWWQQAEALVGLLHAYAQSHEEKFLAHFEAVWQFIQNKIVDHKNGEWYWKVNRAGAPYAEDEKIGFWKCPYHNSRACLEVRARLAQL